MASSDVDVLIAGAGPTGLVLALWLRRLGASVRIVDPAAEPGTTSRALAVHARTLELYRQVGIADEVVAHGLKFGGVNMWVRGAHVARIDLSSMGQGLSPFPYSLIFPQDAHERLLTAHLERAGVRVERGVRLAGFDDRGDGVVARLEEAGGARREVVAAYLAGCDGAHSRAREGIDAGFPGGTYEHLFYVADVAMSGPTANGDLHVALDDADLLAIFPMQEEGDARLIGTVARSAADEGRRGLTWNDVERCVLDRVQVHVDAVHWFSTYRVHHRVANRFARGRVFLLGDAAHVHSPVGGQGMNTGIGDAVNLAWKLADVLDGRAHASLLDTYEPERSAFARRLVATTDRAFTFINSDGPLARLVRTDAVPRLMPALLGRRSVQRLMFRTIAQVAIAYRRSAWSEGRAGGVHGGDRLPWIAPEHAGGKDNHAPLSSLDWQVHVVGDRAPDLAAACEGRRLPLHAFPWSDRAQAAGFALGAAYLVRPDGHVALADPAAAPATLARYLDAHGITAIG